MKTNDVEKNSDFLVSKCCYSCENYIAFQIHLQYVGSHVLIAHEHDFSYWSVVRLCSGLQFNSSTAILLNIICRAHNKVSQMGWSLITLWGYIWHRKNRFCDLYVALMQFFSCSTLKQRRDVPQKNRSPELVVDVDCKFISIDVQE